MVLVLPKNDFRKVLVWCQYGVSMLLVCYKYVTSVVYLNPPVWTQARDGIHPTSTPQHHNIAPPAMRGGRMAG
jgi:hypothetical protein